MLGILLLVTGQVHRSTAATLAQFMVLIALIVPLVKALGLIGAACADLVAVLALTGVLWAAVPKHSRAMLRSPLASIARTGTSAVILGIAAWIVGQQVHAGLLREAIHVGVIAAAYPPLLTTMGGSSGISEATAALSVGIRRRPVGRSDSVHG
jgi:hypothetical protein